MLKARVEISASLQWGVSESDGWFDLVDGDGREWGAIHVSQSVRDGKPFIEYAARVTPPFGTMEATGGIDDLATAMLWIYNRIGVELHVNKAGEIEPLRESAP